MAQPNQFIKHIYETSVHNYLSSTDSEIESMVLSQRICHLKFCHKVKLDMVMVRFIYLPNQLYVIHAYFPNRKYNENDSDSPCEILQKKIFESSDSEEESLSNRTTTVSCFNDYNYRTP